MAGEDWSAAFLKRHPLLSFRRTEATSIAHVISFSRLLKSILDRLKLNPHSIWTMDEIGTSIVHRPDRIVARRRVRQIGRGTSGERGATVIMAFAVFAAGTYILALFIFPRMHYKDYMTIGGPIGCKGVAYPPDG